MEIKMEEFDELSKEKVLKVLKTKKKMVEMEKSLTNAEKRILKTLRKYVENEETVKLNTILNHKVNLIEQTDANLNLAIRYLRESEVDSLALYYVKAAATANKQYEEIKKDEFYLTLHNKYIENATEVYEASKTPVNNI